MAKKPKYLEIGSISTGTLRDDDVIPALLDACDTVRMTRDDREQARDLRKEWDHWQGSEDDRPEWGHESSGEIWEALLDLLGNYAPPYCFVGASEGDGADIGVWVCCDVHSRDEVWDTREPEPEYWEHRLVVTDHGNMTLYDRRGREVWSCV